MCYKDDMSKKKINQTDWKEQRRFHALKLKKIGWKQSEIADAMKVSKGTVSQWISKAEAKGIQSLRIQSPPGRPPGLTEVQNN